MLLSRPVRSGFNRCATAARLVCQASPEAWVRISAIADADFSVIVDGVST